MNKESFFLMNLQKVEKALAMSNRYDIFSQEVIRILIISYLENKESLLVEIKESLAQTLLKYQSVLNLSFKENQAINNEINLFLEQEFPNCHTLNMNMSWLRNTVKEDSYDYLEKLTSNRHSVRNFTNQVVDLELIEKSLKIANSLPTACNRQSCSLLLIKNNQLRKEFLDRQWGNKGFSAPILGAIVVDNTGFTQSNEDISAYLHAGFFQAGLVLGLEANGLSSCVLNWHVSKESNKEIKELLGQYEINMNQKEITALIFIGYALLDKMEAYSIKKKSINLLKVID